MTGAMWGLGTVLGPVIGGAFTSSSAGWRWAFYINLPLGLLTAPVLIFLIPPFDALKGVSFWGRIKRVDWVGIVLLSGSIASLVLALQFGGNEFAWNSGQVIACFVVFGVLLILFMFSQTLYMPGQTKQRRIFPVEMVFFRTTVLLFINIGMASSSAFLAIFYIPLYFEFTRVLPLHCSIVDRTGRRCVESGGPTPPDCVYAGVRGGRRGHHLDQSRLLFPLLYPWHLSWSHWIRADAHHHSRHLHRQTLRFQHPHWIRRRPLFAGGVLYRTGQSPERPNCRGHGVYRTGPDGRADDCSFYRGDCVH